MINPPRDRNLNLPGDAHVDFIPMPAIDARSGRVTAAQRRRFDQISSGYTFFREGDVVFAKITPCMKNGKHAVIRAMQHGFGFGATEFHVLRPTSEVTAEWVHLFLRQPALMPTLVEEMTGAVGQQRLPANVLSALVIPLPPLAEQRRIAERLNAQLAAAARACAAVEAQVEAAGALLAAHLRDAFSRETWPVHPLGDLLAAPLRTGTSKPLLATSTVRCLTLSSVRNGLLDFKATKPVDITSEAASASLVRSGNFYVVRGIGNKRLVGRGALART